MTFMQFWGKYGNLITGISIIFFVIFSWTMIIKDRQLKEEINENCGWGKDDYKCFCEKSEALALQNKIEGLLNPEDLKINISQGDTTNVTLD